MALSSSASSTDRNAKIKIAAAGACLLVASLLLAHNFGIITLWGKTPVPAPMSAEETARIEKMLQEQKQREADLEKIPVNKRPVKAGAG